MTFVVILAAALLSLVYSVFVNVISSDIHQGVPSLASWLIHRRAAKLPGDLRERMHEQWLGDMHSYKTHSGKLYYAVMLFKSQNELLQANKELRASQTNDVSVALTGVESTTSVGNITPSTGELGLTGHAPTVVIGGPDVPVSHVSVSDSLVSTPFFGNADQSTAAIEHWRAASRRDSSYSFYLDSNAILFPQTRKAPPVD